MVPQNRDVKSQWTRELPDRSTTQEEEFLCHSESTNVRHESSFKHLQSRCQKAWSHCLCFPALTCP